MSGGPPANETNVIISNVSRESKNGRKTAENKFSGIV